MGPTPRNSSQPGSTSARALRTSLMRVTSLEVGLGTYRRPSSLTHQITALSVQGVRLSSAPSTVAGIRPAGRGEGERSGPRNVAAGSLPDCSLERGVCRGGLKPRLDGLEQLQAHRAAIAPSASTKRTRPWLWRRRSPPGCGRRKGAGLVQAAVMACAVVRRGRREQFQALSSRGRWR